MKLSDLLVATEPYEGKLVRATRDATTADLVAALREEGVGIEATYYDSEWDGMWFGDEKKRWVDIPPGRYLVVRIDGEET